MKTLYLLRHAKSSRDDPKLRDFERPLAKRGLDDAPVMAGRFMDRDSSVACIISSPANRAKATAKIFATNIGYPVDEIISNPELYFAGTGMFLKAASLVDDYYDSAMLVGHNPAITEFANMMANVEIDNVPTCGLIDMRFEVDTWANIFKAKPASFEFDFHKNAQP